MRLQKTTHRALAALTLGLIAAALAAPHLPAQDLPTHITSDPQLKAARQQLAARHFIEAERTFATDLASHPASVDAQMGIADCELALHHNEAAEIDYRRIVAAHPQLWLAHKNLVVVEAALGRWEEFDRERAILHDARTRNAPGISPRESDVIDSFNLAGQHWVVRAYEVPAGRSLTRYNFERFSPTGRVETFLSLESAAAAAAMLSNPAGPEIPDAAPPPVIHDFALDWYTGSAHGLVRTYATEPTYERLRADALRWIRTHLRAPVPR